MKVILIAVAASPLLFAIQSASAEKSGQYTYSDDGASVTITAADYGISGHVIVPSVIDGKSVTAIGPRVYRNHSGMRSVTVPSSVTSIGEAAFENCLGLTSVTLPDSMTAISPGMFYRCLNLKTITLPDSVTSIGSRAFSSTGLLDFQFPPRVTAIAEETFNNCAGLQVMEIPATVTSIGKGAFLFCYRLRTVTISGPIEEIPDYAFATCFKLTSISFPKGVRKIGAEAFERTRLSTINLAGVREIGDSAFKDCRRLLDLQIPLSVKLIGSGAFSGTHHRESAIFDGNAPQMGSGVFDEAADGFRIFISGRAKGFEFPKWYGYRVSGPAGEISVVRNDSDYLRSKRGSTKFGSMRVHRKSRAAIFTIRNVGNRDLGGLHASLSGSDAADFRIKTIMADSLAPGQTASVKVVFKPKARGKRTARLEIASDDGNENPFVLKLSGVRTVGEGTF